MRDRISIVCATRKRPERLRTMVTTAFDTASHPGSLSFSFYVDDDDVPPVMPAIISSLIVWTIGPRVPLSHAYNAACKESNGVIIHMSADDNVYKTRGWDDAVRAAFDKIPDRLALVYCRDGNQDEKLATHPFLSRRWVDVLGYLEPPHFGGMYSDTWLHEIARHIGRLVYLPDVLIDHLHWSFGKAAMDETYFGVQARSAPESRLMDTMAAERADDAAKLMAAIMGDRIGGCV